MSVNINNEKKTLQNEELIPTDNVPLYDNWNSTFSISGISSNNISSLIKLCILLLPKTIVHGLGRRGKGGGVW